MMTEPSSAYIQWGSGNADILAWLIGPNTQCVRCFCYMGVMYYVRDGDLLHGPYCSHCYDEVSTREEGARG